MSRRRQRADANEKVKTPELAERGEVFLADRGYIISILHSKWTPVTTSTLSEVRRRRVMHIEPVVLASRFSIIGESLEKLRESIDRGFFQDALGYAKQFRLLSDQLAAELE